MSPATVITIAGACYILGVASVIGCLAIAASYIWKDIRR